MPSEFENNSQFLRVHEWLAVASLIGIVAGLTLITSLTNNHSIKKLNQISFVDQNERLEIIVKGAVTYSGIYQLPTSMPLKEILDMAQPQSNADLRRFNLEKGVRRGRVINIPIRAAVVVYLNGAVKAPGEVSLPKGARLEDLLGVVQFADNADTQALRKKRKLKSGEVIEVPFLPHISVPE